MSIQRKGSCHCGRVQFEVSLDKDFSEALSCNCSICQRKGTLLSFVPKAQLKMMSGAESLQDYQFAKKRIHHTFCKVCGVTPFASAVAPDGTDTAAINVRCIENIDLDSLKIHKYDGKNTN